MKTMPDRANPLFSGEYAFRDIHLLAAAADREDSATEGAVRGLQRWIDCFEKARLAGTVFGGGVEAAGEMEGHPSLRQAYELGKTVQSEREASVWRRRRMSGGFCIRI